jgi:hypothetical protein
MSVPNKPGVPDAERFDFDEAFAPDDRLIFYEPQLKASMNRTRRSRSKAGACSTSR